MRFTGTLQSGVKRMDFASMYQDTAGLQVSIFSNILLYVSQACVHTSVNGELKQKNLGKEYPITYSLSNVVSLWCHNTLVHNNSVPSHIRLAVDAPFLLPPRRKRR